MKILLMINFILNMIVIIINKLLDNENTKLKIENRILKMMIDDLNKSSIYNYKLGDDNNAKKSRN